MIKLKIPDEFLNEEVRCDYLVTRQMKELWAVELDLAVELIRVCSKYNLRLAADSGTLLGAVRHHGFIPWDDDMDFYLPREDYKILCEVAAKEFVAPYYWETFYTDPTFVYGAAKLMNESTTGYENPYTKRHGIFIDVFPVDNISNDKQETDKQYKNAFSLFAKYQRVVTCSRPDYWKEPGISLIRRTVRLFYYLKLKVFRQKVGGNYHITLYKRFEYECQKFNNIKTEECSKVSIFSKGRNKHNDFNSIISVPFEFINIPITLNYDRVLSTMYGDWHKLIKGKSLHTFKIIDTNRPYTEVLDERDCM